MENQKHSDYFSKGSRRQKYFSFQSTLSLTPHAVTSYNCQRVKAAIAEEKPVFWVKSESIRSEAQCCYTFPDSPLWNNLSKDSRLEGVG